MRTTCPCGLRAGQNGFWLAAISRHTHIGFSPDIAFGVVNHFQIRIERPFVVKSTRTVCCTRCADRPPSRRGIRWSYPKCTRLRCKFPCARSTIGQKFRCTGTNKGGIYQNFNLPLCSGVSTLVDYGVLDIVYPHFRDEYFYLFASEDANTVHFPLV